MSTYLSYSILEGAPLPHRLYVAFMAAEVEAEGQVLPITSDLDEQQTAVLRRFVWAFLVGRNLRFGIKDTTRFHILTEEEYLAANPPPKPKRKKKSPKEDESAE